MPEVKKKILLIEDDPLLSRMYERLFKLHGYDISVALDPQVGLDDVKVLQPDIILLDIMMPNINGLEALKILKDDAATKNIPVVMITNVEDGDTEKQANDLGAVGYLVKSKNDPDETVEYVTQKLKG